MVNVIKVVACMVLVAAACGCGSDTETPTTIDEEIFTGADPQVLGVCFMGEDHCMSTYVDLGPYQGPEVDKFTKLVPVYMFLAVPPEEGGRGNPLDPDGLYNPFRLQNNVFADDGKVWQKWIVHSADLNLMSSPAPGTILWGIGADRRADFKSGNVRDLFANPIRGEAELLEMAEKGLIRLENTSLNTDCPMVAPKPGDHVINLNPGFRICDQ